MPPGYTVPLFGNNERFGYNYNGKISSIRPASQVELLLDEDESTIHNGLFNPNPIEYLSQNSTAELLAVRHRVQSDFILGNTRSTFGGNVVFADGHGEAMTTKDVLRQVHSSSPISDPVGF